MSRIGVFAFVLLCACSGESTDIPDSDAALGEDAGFADRGVMILDAAPSPDVPSVDADSVTDLGSNPDADPVRPDATGLDAEGPELSPADAEEPVDLGPDAGPSTEDFALPGSYAVEPLSFTSSMIPVSCRAPVGRTSGPAVLISHGFLIPHTQYLGLADHLASWGLLACSVDYAESFSGNHAGSAAEVQTILDAIIGGSVVELSGRVDPTEIALLGHSLGGKLSFLVASARPAVAAVVGFDPVDSAPALCSPQNCPSAIDTLPISMPVLLVGETADEVRTSVIAPACNPADENFDDFYEASGSSTQEVVLSGASHMSFVDDIASCGTVCSVCQPETASRAELLETIRWFTTVFLLQNLEDRTDLDAALRGSIAQSLFVQPGRATLRSK